MKFKTADRSNLLQTLERINKTLSKGSKKLAIRVLGGASILLLGLRERTTVDIDIAATSDASQFQKLCAKIGIPVDIITVASTVDLNYCPITTVFKGSHLTVDSVTPKDLIKLKLERFYKQDPEDIYAIIKHETLSFDEFKEIVSEMVPNYIGNTRELILSAKIVVEQIYPDCVEKFKL